ncbi:MAG: hypothetical protein ACJAS1_003180, partial [Oleiphilaceae bacterium]
DLLFFRFELTERHSDLRSSTEIAKASLPSVFYP